MERKQLDMMIKNMLLILLLLKYRIGTLYFIFSAVEHF